MLYSFSHSVNTEFNLGVRLLIIGNIWYTNSPVFSPSLHFFFFLQSLVFLLRTEDAQDMACLINGYYRLFEDPNHSLLPDDETKAFLINTQGMILFVHKAIQKIGLSQKPACIGMITARRSTRWRLMVLGSLNHLERIFVYWRQSILFKKNKIIAYLIANFLNLKKNK